MDFGRLKDVKLHGFGKIMHGFVMVITYPLRHFFKFIAYAFVFAVILAAIPMMQGVRYTDIFDWYLLRYEPDTDPVKAERAGETTSLETEEKYKEVSAPKIVRAEEGEKIEQGPGQRRAFKKKPPEPETEQAPRRQYPVMKIKPPAENFHRQRGTHLSADNTVSADVPAKELEKKSLQQENIKLDYRKIDTLPLVYEENPQTVSGQAFVFNANEMSVGNTYIILYGVYTDPEKYNQELAHEYMKELADGKILSCHIVAYTYQNIATGLCFLDGININKNLVDAGLADNVAL